MAKIKRSLVKTFLNTGSIVSPVWELLGDGVVAGTIAYNPKITEETYIIADSASISVDSYAPTFPVEMTAISGDAVFEYLDDLRKDRAVLGDAETEIVNVWLYETPALGYYAAEKQAVSLQIEDFGGEGGSPTKLNYTINFIGDPVKGAFDPLPTADFVAEPVLAVLETMVIGSVTLTPLFAVDKHWLYYAGSVAASTVSMTSTCLAAGAVIVQKEGANVVNQGANAALTVGVNHLTIEVTVGSEVVVYHIDITRTV